MRKIANQNVSVSISLGMGFTALTLLVIFLLFRTTGIHCDENNYLNLAVTTPFGDSATMSKPVLFYWLNFHFYHLLGEKLGFLRPISLHLFYILLFAVSLVVSLRSFKLKDQLLFFGFLISSPLVLMNTTQLMMETLVFPFTLIAIFFSFQSDRTHFQNFLLVLCTAIAMAAKMTAIFAFGPLCICLFSRFKKTSALVVSGMLLGMIFHKLTLRWWVHATSEYQFASVTKIIQPAWVLHRLRFSTLAEYFYGWFWFGGAILLFCCLLAARGIASKKYPSRIVSNWEVLTLTGSFILSMLLLITAQQVPPNAEIIRYGYPAFLATMVVSSLYLIDRKPALLLVLTCLQLFASTPLFRTDWDRFRNWPSLYQFESAGSGGTAFFGVPTHRLAIALAKKSSPACLLTVGNQVLGHWTSQYLAFVSPGFQDRSKNQCSSPDLFLSERGSNIEETRQPCSSSCPKENPRWSGCSFQDVIYFSGYFGKIRREFCWLK